MQDAGLLCYRLLVRMEVRVRDDDKRRRVGYRYGTLAGSAPDGAAPASATPDTVHVGYMPVKAVAEQGRVHWTTIKDAEIRSILGLLRKRDLSGITDLGTDEVSEKKGHRYLRAHYSHRISSTCPMTRDETDVLLGGWLHELGTRGDGS